MGGSGETAGDVELYQMKGYFLTVRRGNGGITDEREGRRKAYRLDGREAGAFPICWFPSLWSRRGGSACVCLRVSVCREWRWRGCTSKAVVRSSSKLDGRKWIKFFPDIAYSFTKSWSQAGRWSWSSSHSSLISNLHLLQFFVHLPSLLPRWKESNTGSPPGCRSPEW